MLEALKIMQMIGVDYMLEKGMEETLIHKGILTEDEIKQRAKLAEKAVSYLT